MRGPPLAPARWQALPQSTGDADVVPGACWGDRQVGTVITQPSGSPVTFPMFDASAPGVLRGGEAHDFTVYAGLADGYEILSDYDVTLVLHTYLFAGPVLPMPVLEVPVPVRGIALHVIADRVEAYLRFRPTGAIVTADDAYFYAACRYGRPQYFRERQSGVAPGDPGQPLPQVLVPWGTTGARVLVAPGAASPLAPHAYVERYGTPGGGVDASHHDSDGFDPLSKPATGLTFTLDELPQPYVIEFEGWR